MRVEVYFVQHRNCWAIECDCLENYFDADSFISACRKYLNKERFPDSLWYHRRGSDKSSRQCVECYGPNAKKDAKAAAIILAGVASTKRSEKSIRRQNAAPAVSADFGGQYTAMAAGE